MASLRMLEQARDFPEQDVPAFLHSMLNAINSGQASDTMDALRQLHAFVAVNTSRASLQLPQNLINALMTLLTEPQDGFLGSQRTRTLCASLLVHCAGSASIVAPSLPVDFSPPVERRSLPLALPALLSLGPISRTLSYIPYLSMCVTAPGIEPDVRVASYDTLSQLVGRGHTSVSAHASIDQAMQQWLRHASTVSAPQGSASTLFVAPKKPMPITELDGANARGFFTVINTSQTYTLDQLLNVHAFSSLNLWLCHRSATQGVKAKSHEKKKKTTTKTKKKKTKKRVEEQGQKDEGKEEIEDEEEDEEGREREREGEGDSRNGDVVSVGLRDTAIEYCLRVLEQADWRSYDEDRPPKNEDRELIDSATVECISILSCISSASTQLSVLIPRLVPPLTRALSRLNTHTSAAVYPQFLRFLARFGPVVMHSSEGAYELFFGTVLPRALASADPRVPFEAVEFALDARDSLEAHSKVFEVYFPVFFKALAWNPRSLLTDIIDLLPSFITNETYLEVFHCILDLPSVAFALEKSRETSYEQGPSAALFSPLLTYLLRNEAVGESSRCCFWSVSTARLLSKFVEGTSPRLRVQSACEATIPLLHAFFHTLLARAAPPLIRAVLPVLLQRAAVLFPFRPFQKTVQFVLASKVVSLFSAEPRLICDCRHELIDFISQRRGSYGKEELLLHLVWAIGEHASVVSDPRCTSDVLVLYHEALELFAYEVNAVTSQQKSVSSASASSLTGNALSDDATEYTTRLMTVLMTALAKIASRCQDLTPRVQLALTKIVKQHRNADEGAVVLRRAAELTQILHFPSIASAVLTPSKTALSDDAADNTDVVMHVLQSARRLTNPPL